MKQTKTLGHHQEDGLDETLYVPEGGTPRELGRVMLALQVPDAAPVVAINGCTVAWTPEALAALADLQRDASAVSQTKQSLPYASLRGLLEVYLSDVVRIDRGVGLDTSYSLSPHQRGTPKPFLWTEGTADLTMRGLSRVLEQWLPNYLFETYVKPAKVGQRSFERLEHLRQSNGLLRVAGFESTILPWTWDPRTQTARARDDYCFCALADHVARHLAGKVLLPGLSPLRRVVASHASNASSELMTDPIALEGRDAFSLALRLDVETMPGMHQPLLCVAIAKRRWLGCLEHSAYGVDTINGFVLPTAPCDRAFGFAVNRRPERGDAPEGGIADNAFEVLRQHFGLPLRGLDGRAIAAGDASTDAARALLVYRSAVASDTHRVKAGVPDLDRLEAFEGVASSLKELGLVPIKTPDDLSVRAKRFAATAAIASPRPLTAAVLGLVGGDDDDGEPSEDGEAPQLDTAPPQGLTAQSIDGLSEAELGTLLHDRLRLRLDSLHVTDRSMLLSEKRSPAQATEQLQLLIEANRAAIAGLYPGTKPRLVLLHEHGDTAQSRLLRAIVNTLWGTALEVVIQCLPPDTHGPKHVLPGRGERNTERARRRCQQWEPLARQIAADGRPTLCLVMAPQWYSGPNGQRAPDDKVNKPAARKTLAARGGATVQYLLPPQYDRGGGLLLSDFVYRSQAALRDLVWAHAGHVEGVGEAVAEFFGTGPEAPQQILGITIIQRNRTRRQGNQDATFLPVALRIDVATGRCEMRHACQGRDGELSISPWRAFSQALGSVAEVSPVKLAATKPDRATRFQRFCDQVISEAVDAGAHPVVVIDSSNCATLWPWLSDRCIGVSGIAVNQRQWVEDDWAGARLVRVRQGLAPSVIVDKSWSFTATSRGRKASPRSRTLRLPTAPLGGALYKMVDQGPEGCAAYLSFGAKRLHSNKRGLSCYRPVTVVERTVDTDPATQRKLVRLRSWKPTLDYWPSPNAIEVVVSLRPPGDAPDRIAQFVESLRQGFGHYCEWTSLPAPLFFERVVHDYVCGFSLADDESGQ